MFRLQLVEPATSFFGSIFNQEHNSNQLATLHSCRPQWTVVYILFILPELRVDIDRCTCP